MVRITLHFMSIKPLPSATRVLGVLLKQWTNSLVLHLKLLKSSLCLPWLCLPYCYTPGYWIGGSVCYRAVATRDRHKSEWVQRWKCRLSCCCWWNCFTLGSLLWAAGNCWTTPWQWSRYIGNCNCLVTNSYPKWYCFRLQQPWYTHLVRLGQILSESAYVISVKATCKRHVLICAWSMYIL